MARENLREIATIVEELMQPITDSSSSSDDDGCEKYLRRTIAKMTNFIEITVPSYDDISFRQHFRMSRRITYELIDLLERSTFLPTYQFGMKNLTAEKSFLLTLWYLSNTETFRQVSDRFGVSLSSAHRVLMRVTDFIISLKGDYITWPKSINAKNEISRAFMVKQGLPDVIGAIDGCHVRIQRPATDELSYINRKGYHSILIQGICTADKVFTNVYIGEPGSIHDARLLRKSAIFEKGDDQEYFGKYYLLGDSAYPSLNWLVPPYKESANLDARKKQFNYKHSASRIVIEHAYGLLKGRFRRLQFFQNIDVKVIIKCTFAASILHNICLLRNDNSYIDPVDVTQDLNSNVNGNEVEQFNNVCNSRREDLLEQLFN